MAPPTNTRGYQPLGWKELDIEHDKETTATADPYAAVSSGRGGRKKKWNHIYLGFLVSALLVSLVLFRDHFFNGYTKPPSFAEASDAVNLAQCPSNGAPLPASPPSPINLWAPLSNAEIIDIQAWLHSPDQGLNLTDGGISKPSDNIIFQIEAYHPPKADALAYLDAQDRLRRVPQAHKQNLTLVRTPPPQRFARVTIEHGGWVDPVVRDYLVGPLPISKTKTRIRRLTEIYHRDEVPHNSRGMADFSSLAEFLAGAVAPMADAVLDLFGGTAGTFAAGFNGPWGYDGSFRRAWMSWRINEAGSYVLPINFYQYVDASGTDPSLWKILKVVYHNQTFPSPESFLAAYNNKTLVVHPRPNATVSWTRRTRTRSSDTDRSPPSLSSSQNLGDRPALNDDHRDLENLPGPRSVSFKGLRFRVDRGARYVSWMGWGVYLGFGRDVGLRLWDVRFKGERVIYELSLQEAMVQYAGNDPVQSTTAWLDSYFGMGFLTRNLLPHYDCPSEAVFLPSSALFHPLLPKVQPTLQRERAVCVFERDVGRPVTRHFGDLEGEFGAVKGFELVVRSVTTVGNYDYINAHLKLENLQFDYIFQLDGSIEVKVSASGYLQGGYWTGPEQAPYGTRIHERSMGNVHDHVFNFKVDLDIAGLNNTFLKTTSHKEHIKPPWASSSSSSLENDWPEGDTIIQQRVHREYITSETDSRVRLAENLEGSFAIVNQDEKNAWGNPRGYAVHPGLSMIRNTILGSKRLEKNANWAWDNLAVSLRKDTEPSSSSMWNLHLPGAPPVDLNKFFDGEDIEQKDLVLWVNLGTHHLPQAEDAPNTKTNVATSSFLLTPLNYFDADPSMDLMNSVTLSAPSSPDDKYTFDDNGVEQHFHCVPQAPAPFAYGQSDSAAAFGASAVGGPEGSGSGEERMKAGEWEKAKRKFDMAMRPMEIRLGGV